MIWGAYVHVPWCRVICPYCAFAVVPDHPGAAYDAWADRIAWEWERRPPGFDGLAETVYVGGGTPSRLPNAVLRRVLDLLPRQPGAEVTAEVNPEDLSAASLAGLQAAGVNRVSLGVQSFDRRHLRRLGRPSPIAALSLIQRAGLTTWSADLMFGLSDQSMADLDLDLDHLLAAEPPHLSVYGLTVEPGTPFARAAARGRLRPADDDLWREMYDHLVVRLAAAGLARYEVSNFARPGHESRHNRGYWQDIPYLGLGPSAHGLAPDGSRWVNHRDLDTWLTAPDAIAVREPPDPDREARDRLISGLRGREGIDFDAFAQRYAMRPASAEVRRMEAAGYLEVVGPVVRLGPAGWPLADAIVARLVSGLEPLRTG